MSKNKFVTISHPPDGGFLQSEHWAQFNRALGRKVVEMGENDFSVLMILHELPLVGGYFFVPRGPVIRNSKFEIRNSKKYPISNLKKYIEQLIKFAQSNKAGWVRVEPQSKEDLELIKISLAQKFKIVKSKKNHEPAQTLMIDLQKNEEEMLMQMKSKTRYNIRLAEKKGVEVYQSRTDQDIEQFIQLIQEAAKRDRITPHPDGYYRKMVQAISSDVLKLYFARYQNEVISTALVVLCGAVATYLHGASSNEHRNVMAPFALQWRAMQDAKEGGCKKYDLGGTKLKKKSGFRNQESVKFIPEAGSWAGITRFKQGFCPNNQPVEFPGCWDVILDNKKYFSYKLLQGVKDFFK